MQLFTCFAKGVHGEPYHEIFQLSQYVETATMISQEVGYDARKQIHGRKRHLSVDLLGLVLRVLVTSASVPERAGAKKSSNELTIWAIARRATLRVSHLSLAQDLDGWGISRGRIYALGDGYVPVDC